MDQQPLWWFEITDHNRRPKFFNRSVLATSRGDAMNIKFNALLPFEAQRSSVFTAALWIHELASWTHAVTLTFKRRDIKCQAVSEQIIVQALRHFLRVLDKCCYSGTKVRRGACVPSVVVIGWGAYNDHPHAHLALACPEQHTHETFDTFIDIAAEATDWIDQERRVETYRNEGWAEYMLNHGIDNLITNLTRAHQPEIVG